MIYDAFGSLARGVSVAYFFPRAEFGTVFAISARRDLLQKPPIDDRRIKIFANFFAAFFVS